MDAIQSTTDMAVRPVDFGRTAMVAPEGQLRSQVEEEDAVEKEAMQ